MRLYFISYKPIPPARVIIAGQMDPGGSFNRMACGWGCCQKSRVVPVGGAIWEDFLRQLEGGKSWKYSLNLGFHPAKVEGP